MRRLSARYLTLDTSASTDSTASAAPLQLPPPKSNREYLLYVHVPFCERLCPYCSFNRYPFNEVQARAYFDALRREMLMLAQQGYRFGAMYIGGGTPTIQIDELVATIDLAYQLFDLKEVSAETNPNHLYPPWLDALAGRVQRLSVGVQSFDNQLLAQMQRLDKYGSGLEILRRLEAEASTGRFVSLNADMIFNFPSQTTDILINDLAHIIESGVNQATFYPLMASPAVERSLAATIGKVDYGREPRFYALISEALCGLSGFDFGSAWTFNRHQDAVIDEYIVDHEEYPAIGAGGFSYLDGQLFVNTFSVNEYIRLINAGRLSVVGHRRFTHADQMRYRLMMQLFGLRLDKHRWRQDFGSDLCCGLPGEYAFFKLTGALATDNNREITLSPKGRYLLVALMREFFIGVNTLRDQARASLPGAERELLFG
ncbi:MAG: coproporphyrinogen III oxidase family protein [Coriobacteriales bacterium]|jgi:coproporphyrinogen III oxidase-like Fe-S oxidoreductase|nr:coproporphyrinogen III oxidase family protein [Coriobacteriales bacterium]